MSEPLLLGIGGHHSARARTDEWLTPPAVIDALGGAASFDLDPASPIDRPWPTAREHYTVLDNGLLKPWYGRVWLNPPYGRTIGRWLARMASHGRGVAMIFARTDTEAFSQHVWEAAAGLLFVRGRLDFHRIDGAVGRQGRVGNSGAPSVLCAYGSRDLEILASCGIAGKLVPLRLDRAVLVVELGASWREVVGEFLRSSRQPVRLDELYRAFAGHAKSRRNPNYRAKIRQVLQQGPFQRVARGTWRAREAA